MLGRNPYLKYFSKEGFREYIDTVDSELSLEVVQLKERVSIVRGIVFQVGDDQASDTYIRSKMKLCEKFGIELSHIKTSCRTKDVLNTLVNSFGTTQPMMIQFPLPWKGVTANSFNLGKMDIDGLHSSSVVDPCTPAGILRHLKYVYDKEGVNIEGKNILIISRSQLVGMPMARMAVQAGMNVMQIHSKTSKRDREWFYGMADVIVCGVGKPNFITLGDADDFMRPDVMIYDVGINRAEDGTLAGDCSPDLIAKGYAVSPVPGGVGLLTTRMFVQNILTITRKMWDF